MPLTAKQQRFVEEYLVDLNATQAAIRSGYSAKTARSVGAENLTKPDIQAAIQERRSRIAAKLEVTQERIVAELARIAFSDIRKVVKWRSYDAATLAVQRIQKEGGLASLGFSTLEYVGGGKRAEIVLAGGIGSSMPANTTFGLNTKSFRLRYNPNRNFDTLFKGEGQKPINQDAIAQYIGWMGELTQTNPLFNWRFYDSNPSA